MSNPAIIIVSTAQPIQVNVKELRVTMLKLYHQWPLTSFEAYVWFLCSKEREYKSIFKTLHDLLQPIFIFSLFEVTSWRFLKVICYCTKLGKMILELLFFWCSSRNRPHTIIANPGVNGHQVAPFLVFKKTSPEKDINFLPHVGKEAKMQWDMETSQGPPVHYLQSQACSPESMIFKVQFLV